MMGLEEDRCERSRKLQEYVAALEEERRKMEVFRRELPLCLDLVAHAIKIYRQQAAASEPSSSETSGEGGHPILEEFIPLKPSSSSEEENNTPGHHHRRHRLDGSGNSANNKEEEEKSTESGCWLQLWNDQNCSDPSKDNTSAEHAPAVEEGGGGGEKAGHHHHRKARRCWSPELHRQFLHALQKLGGSHVATPKQIREVMKVDGLSNDEVKSHLQKYRLHTRQPSPAAPVNNGSPQTPQLVLGIWVPPYSTVAAAAVPPSANGTYSSIPSLPLELKQSQRPSPSDSTATLTSS